MLVNVIHKKVTGITGSNGVAQLTSVKSKTLHIASATMTLKSMTAKGYTYNLTQNLITAITVTW